MNKAEYTTMADFEKEYWWHKGKLFLVKTLIEKYFPGQSNLKILEIGCGTGEVTNFLSNYGEVTGVDVSAEAVECCKRMGLVKIELADINQMDLSKWHKSFDLVLTLDVLEHIQDDVETIRRVKTLLKPNGYFFVNVPAHKFLWSEHDEALHHKRRYHSLEITQKLKDNGFEIVKKSHFVAIAFPGIAFFRMWSNLFKKSAYPKTSYVPLPKFLNDLMILIIKMEANILKHVNLHIGTTITVVAKPTA